MAFYDQKYLLYKYKVDKSNTEFITWFIVVSVQF